MKESESFNYKFAIALIELSHKLFIIIQVDLL